MPVAVEMITAPSPSRLAKVSGASSGALGMAADETDRVVGLSLIGDYLMYGGDAALTNTPNILPHLIALVNPSDPTIATEYSTRHNAAFCIGFCAQHSGTFFSPFATHVVSALLAAVTAPPPASSSDDDDESQESVRFLMCRDNVVAALCRLAEHQSISAPSAGGESGRDVKMVGGMELNQLLRTVLAHLPLTHDAEEACYVHSFLARLVADRSPVVLSGGDGAIAGEAITALVSGTPLPSTSKAIPFLTHIFRVMATVVDTKYVAPATNATFTASLRALRPTLPSPTLTEYASTITPQRRDVLNKLFG